MSDTLRIDLAPSPRPGLDRLARYTRPTARAASALRLDGNEGPLQATPELLRCYPDDAELRAALATRFSVDDDAVLLGAGADELLDRACRAFLAPGRAAVAPTPCFAMLPRYVALAGGELRAVPWLAGAAPIDALAATAAARDVALVVLTSPCNPTGLTLAASAIAAIARAAPQALVLCDLAYVEFARVEPTRELLALPNVVVLRTFSKAFGRAGLRVGYALGAPPLLRWLAVCGSPYPVAAPSLRAAARALSDGVPVAAIEQIAREREWLAELLRACGCAADAGEANFVLAHARDVAARDAVVIALAAAGIAVRTFDGDPQLAASLRITCPGDTAAFARLAGVLQTQARRCA